MIKLTAIGALVLLLIGCTQLQESSDIENVYMYKITKGEDIDILLQLSFSFDWGENVFEMEIPFIKEKMNSLQSTPQTLKAKQSADGSDFWCDSITTFIHEPFGDVKVIFSYAYSRSPNEIKSNGQIDLSIPFGKDGHGEEGEISYNWKWIDAK